MIYDKYSLLMSMALYFWGGVSIVIVLISQPGDNRIICCIGTMILYTIIGWYGYVYR